MLSVLADRQFGIEVDDEGYLFLDRDPAWFSGVLAYLRGCCHFAPDPLRADFTLAVDSALNLTSFLREAQYYQIQGLCGMLKERRLLALREPWPCIAVINGRSSLHPQPGHVDVHLYDIAAQVWYSKSYVQEQYENTDFVTCSDGRFIYMIGSFVHPATKKRTIDCFDIHTGVWELVASLDDTSLEKVDIRAAYLQQASILVVSHDKYKFFVPPKLHVIDLASGVIQELACAGHAPYQFLYATCLVQGRLILAGGYNETWDRNLVGHGYDNSKMTRAWEYDLQEHIWRILTSMEHQHTHAVAVKCNGKAVVVGGIRSDNSSVDTVDVFDPTYRCWSALPAMQRRRQSPWP